MATGLLDQMGLDKKDFNEIKEQTAGGSIFDSGVYEVAVDTAFIRKTDSGAKMLEITFIAAGDKPFRWSTCTQSGKQAIAA